MRVPDQGSIVCSPQANSLWYIRGRLTDQRSPMVQKSNMRKSYIILNLFGVLCLWLTSLRNAAKSSEMLRIFRRVVFKIGKKQKKFDLILNFSV